MEVKFKVLKRCRACQSEKLRDVIDLGETAIADDFFKTQDNTQRYPLTASLCENCGLLQLRHVVDPSAIYDDYIYYTSSSPGLQKHFSEYAKDVHQVLGLAAGSTVMDLGCNDGVLLSEFEKLGCEIVGIEPSEHTTEELRNRGVSIFCGYWDDELRAKIIASFGTIDVVTANNVFANVDDIRSFTNNVVRVLPKKGTFIVETGSHLSLMDNFVFDNIYHEHLSYFSVSALNHFFSQFGMEIFHVEKVPTKGGSIRVYAGFTDEHVITQNVDTYIAEEEACGLFSLDTYTNYMQRIATLRKKVRNKLSELQTAGVKLIGFGASATTTTVLHVLGIAEFLSYLVDDNLVKQGTYSPGYRLEVRPTEAIYQDKGSCIVILPWRFAQMFMHSNQLHLQNCGTFLEIMPNVSMIDTLNSEIT